ncbi:MAG: DUF389 domain-containing protein [Prochloraceae cyanobacterium]|nr:DUF389 domain-containing protein [Prochloraceae cyanobacterium]
MQHQHWKLFKNFGLGAIPIIQLRESLIEECQLNQNYLVLTVSSCLIATFGLIINSAAVIIGAMIIAPLMLPLRGLPFAALEADLELLRKSFISILVGSLIAIFCSSLVGVIIGFPSFGSEVASRTQPTLIDLLIAITAGSISGYAKVRPAIGDAIPGTAISVALMPPLCVIGLTLSQGQWQLTQGATLLYLTNLIGINFACLIVYFLAGYAGSDEVGQKISWGIAIILMSLLAIPLGFSFWQLLDQERVERSIPKAILDIERTDIKIKTNTIDYANNPPLILIEARATKVITGSEILAIENALQKELNRDFKVVFDLTLSREIDSSTIEEPKAIEENEDFSPADRTEPKSNEISK